MRYVAHRFYNRLPKIDVFLRVEIKEIYKCYDVNCDIRAEMFVCIRNKWLAEIGFLLGKLGNVEYGRCVVWIKQRVRTVVNQNKPVSCRLCCRDVICLSVLGKYLSADN